MVNAHLVTGKEGEALALTYLQDLGYKLHDRNVRLGRDEIDLVMFDPLDRVVVFVEVKTRLRSGISPSRNLTFKKKDKLRRSARKWVAHYDYDGGYRIDVVFVIGTEVVGYVKELAWQ